MNLCFLTAVVGFFIQVFGQSPKEDWKPLLANETKSVIQLDTVHWMENQYGIGYLEGGKGLFFVRKGVVYQYKAKGSKIQVLEEHSGNAFFAIKAEASSYQSQYVKFKKGAKIESLDFLFDNQKEQEFYILRGKAKFAIVQIPSNFKDEKDHNWHEYLDNGIRGNILSQVVEVYCFKIKVQTETKFFYFLKLRYGKIGGQLLEFEPSHKMTIIKPAL